MKFTVFSFFLLIGLSFFTSCKKEETLGPGAAAIKNKVVGKYCGDFESIEIQEDGKYHAIRYVASNMTNRPIMEQCIGRYSFEKNMQNKTWELVLLPCEKRSHPLVKCASRQLVWQQDSGYVIGDTILTLKSPFSLKVREDKVLTNSSCE